MPRIRSLAALAIAALCSPQLVAADRITLIEAVKSRNVETVMEILKRRVDERIAAQIKGLGSNVIFVWSALTAVSGMARSFPQLIAARLCVGVGEATCAPASPGRAAGMNE